MKKLTSIVCSRGLIAAALIGAGHSIAFAQDTYGDRLNIGLGHTLTGTYSSIAGGTNNTINAPFATIGGGVGNRNDATYGFLGAGNANVNQGYAAVTVGGESNVNT
ncbi:MAG: hypothetical protein JWR69_790, partial [Pedosphaera sp.]|nr:hypothetical protein [Pedosphaera sp.]